jgi:ribosomal protein S6
MQDNSNEDAVIAENAVIRDEDGEETAGKVKFYEVGYVLLPSIAKEKVMEQVAVITNALAKAGAKVVANGDPELTPLAYIMIKKIHGINHRFDDGYFGWVKFELAAGAIASVKKALDADESILRYLLKITVKENTYLGKRAPVYTLGVAGRGAGIIAPEAPLADVESVNHPSAPATSPAPSTPTLESEQEVASSVIPPLAASSVVEMDKSIDDMVKDA